MDQQTTKTYNQLAVEYDEAINVFGSGDVLQFKINPVKLFDIV